ncbi:bifunctional folylpolyglutamate synthase/dihydrofolate synthase [Sunxiuqinia sp. A32]|uniref:bifunctional folylpolyglutamate synthase/dihydrofolate synthase n=1 Tax=Sunxiuqinia sp. A32 TaxID=3461496 RepID=UPI0040452CFD
MTSYEKVLKYLYEQLPMFQRTGPVAYKNTLGNTLALDEMFANPHHHFKSIHVAGTNGKGSSSHMLASVFQEAGYKTGLYTSPHLIDFRERIRVNGEMITEDGVVDFVEKFTNLNESVKLEPSFFELTVAMAFDYFKKQEVDIAIIEVGLGGRLDSTNIIQPEVSLITNISFDHTALLGNSIEEIANEKAGIIKSKIPTVVSESDDLYDFVFQNKAKEKQSPIYFADQEYHSEYSMFLPEGKQVFNIKRNTEIAFPGLKSDLLGNYQSKNIYGALKVLEICQTLGWEISQEAICAGFENVSKNTGLRGRWEIVGNNPLMVCDTAHNFAGLSSVLEQIKNTPYKNLHLVLGMVNDKNIDQILELLPKNANYFFTEAKIPRALPAEELALKASASGIHGKVIKPVHEAVARAVESAQPEDLIFIGGSTFVVADYFS